jgi:glycyl-tRNA synthetase beta chain
MACRPDSPLDFENRVKAVDEFSKLDVASELAAANKRIGNLLKKYQGRVPTQVRSDLLQAGAEQQLHEVISSVEQKCRLLFDEGNYSQGLEILVSLRNPVDDFFEQVMVMSDDPEEQKNRLALLKRMQDLFLCVADISILQS